MRNDQTRIELESGKYVVCHKNGADFHALRYGEYWRDLTGDGLVLAMAQRIEDLEEELRRSRFNTPVNFDRRVI